MSVLDMAGAVDTALGEQDGSVVVVMLAVDVDGC